MLENALGAAVMDVIGDEHRDSGMTMLGVFRSRSEPEFRPLPLRRVHRADPEQPAQTPSDSIESAGCLILTVALGFVVARYITRPAVSNERLSVK